MAYQNRPGHAPVAGCEPLPECTDAKLHDAIFAWVAVPIATRTVLGDNACEAPAKRPEYPGRETARHSLLTGRNQFLLKY